MVWGATPGNISPVGDPGARTINLDGIRSKRSVTVRNLGTGPLTFFETAGVRLGGPNSPAVITDLLVPALHGDIPGQLAPHGVKNIVFGVHRNGADADATITHTLQTDDPIEAHAATLKISVQRTNYPHALIHRGDILIVAALGDDALQIRQA